MNMNMVNFDLKNIDGFNNLNKESKYKVMNNFNLLRYKFIIDELKEIYNNINDLDTKKILEEKINKMFKEGCNNFYIINSNYTCNIYINGKYYLYFNTKSKKNYLCLVKKNLVQCNDNDNDNDININNKDDNYTKDNNYTKDDNFTKDDNDNKNYEYKGYYILGNDLIWKKVIN